MTSTWQAGRLKGRGAAELLFGRMFEDVGLELALFPEPPARVLCIASAGDTAFALSAAGYHVTAVDINPAQIDYVRSRLEGAPPRAGEVDRLLARARRLAPLLGWTERRLLAFLRCDDVDAQQRLWRERLCTRRLRWAMRLLVTRPVLRRGYDAAFVAALPPRFGGELLARLDRGFARHPNRANPYAWQLLLGRDPPDDRHPAPAPERLRLLVGDVATVLERSSSRSFDAMTLSNVLDATPPAYRARLRAAVTHAVAPGGVALLRTFAPATTAEAGELAARDRSLLWGAVERL